MWRWVIVLCVAGALTGCDSVRDVVGSKKVIPDEFAVMPNAPLVMPPDYNLHPPKSGTRAANMPDPSERARASLYPNDPQAVAATVGPGFSDGEKLLLAYSGAANADPSIRARLAADVGQEEGGQGFADTVLFWQGPSPDTGTPVDAQAEAERLKKAQAAGKPVAEDKSPDNLPTGNTYPAYPPPSDSH